MKVIRFENSGFERKGSKRKNPLAGAESRKRSVSKAKFKWSISDDVVDEMLAELREQENAIHE